MGLTSSDVIDTALSLAMKQSLELIIDKLNEFIKVLKILAKKYKNTITLGRTHGIHAEPTSFGLKWLSYLSEAERNKERLEKTLEDVSQGKLSGAVGNYANIDPSIEKKVLEKLSLMPCKISTQIVPRDIHAEFLYNLSLLGAGIERIALEIRHLQRSEVQEAFEPFTKGQRGSSAMPHKKNPIISERLCGMARLLRSNADAAAENIALWHERDISHSSIERIIIPDSCLIAFYMIEKVTWMVEGIDVKEDQMIEQFKRSYNLVFSQRVMLSLVNKGFSREDAYKLTQKVALECWKTKKDFKEEIKKVNDDEHYFSKNEIEDIFNPIYFLKNISKIYERFNFEDEE
jgi:adenylosuccinate lyase